MPTYRNSSKEILWGTCPYTEFKANTDTVAHSYVKNLPVWVTLISHDPVLSPWVLLETVLVAPQEQPIDIAMYDYVVIYNATASSVTVSANTDDTNSMILPCGVRDILDNTNRMMGCVSITSKVAPGAVYVWGSN
jgi:hypothetical protein